MAYYDENISEDSLKDKVKKDFFSAFDCTNFPGKKVDFTVKDGKSDKYFLWAESKAGTCKDDEILGAFIQLILTIAKLSIAEKMSLPNFLGAFDATRIIFIPYNVAREFFLRAKDTLPPDVDWKNVTPSDRPNKKKPWIAKEFKQLLDYEKAEEILQSGMIQIYFAKKNKPLRGFIEKNFREGVGEVQKIDIENIGDAFDVYSLWAERVLPTIEVANWASLATKDNLYNADLYFADLMADPQNNYSLSKEFENLRVSLETNSKGTLFYKPKKKENKEQRSFDYSEFHFNDGALAHKMFWNLFNRPPCNEEFCNYILEHRHLFLPREYRELKGAFYTPPIWAKKSKEYLKDVLGDNWLDDFIIWDCCAGTGNLLDGFDEKKDYKYNIFASTLDLGDVQIMRKERGEAGTGQLLDAHIFQFDFLNDPIEKLPDELQSIVCNKEKRKKLIFYINPPYVESGNKRQLTGTGDNKVGLVLENKAFVGKELNKKIGRAHKEIYAQFFARIYEEFSGCWLAEFSTLKILQSTSFKEFRNFFQAKLEKKPFVVPSKTFRNVKKNFPIGFMIWNTGVREKFKETQSDIFEADGSPSGQKRLFAGDKTIGDWISNYKFQDVPLYMGMLNTGRLDFQNQNLVYIKQKFEDKSHAAVICPENLIPCCVFLSVRWCIPENWLNNRDQFFFPNEGWKEDSKFHSDCLIFTIFHDQNHIPSSNGENHWNPFRNTSQKSFMWKFLNGELTDEDLKEGFRSREQYPFHYDGTCPVMTELSEEAKNVFDAGKELWEFYHKQPGAKLNPSLFDIRKHFQGVTVETTTKKKFNKKIKEYVHKVIVTEELIDIRKNVPQHKTPTYEEYKKLKYKLDGCVKELGDRIAKEYVYKYGFLIK